MSEADKTTAVAADDVQAREPGFGTALIAVGVIIVTVAVPTPLTMALLGVGLEKIPDAVPWSVVVIRARSSRTSNSRTLPTSLCRAHARAERRPGATQSWRFITPTPLRSTTVETQAVAGLDRPCLCPKNGKPPPAPWLRNDFARKK